MLVVSPLLSLSDDQSRYLGSVGVAAESLSGNSKRSTTKRIIAALESASSSDVNQASFLRERQRGLVVFTTAEKLVGRHSMNHTAAQGGAPGAAVVAGPPKDTELMEAVCKCATAGGLKAIVFDECQEIVTSRSYRPSGRRLLQIEFRRPCFERTPFIFLTATPNVAVLTELAALARIPTAPAPDGVGSVPTSGCRSGREWVCQVNPWANREGVAYTVDVVSNALSQQELCAVAVRHVRRIRRRYGRHGRIIVFCPTPSGATRVHAVLTATASQTAADGPVGLYLGSNKMKIEQRRSAHLEFANSEGATICCTSAFGLGVSCKDVVGVVNLGLPYDTYVH